MKDADKHKFILEAIERIKDLKEEIKEARKNHVNTDDLMRAVQREVTRIQEEAEHVFESSDVQMSDEELQKFIQNPSNFSREDWELLEKIKTETSECKKEILKTNQPEESAQDLIAKKSKGSLKKRKRGKPKPI